MCFEYGFDLECNEYLVAVVDGQVWGFLQGHHDSTAWAACLVSPTPPETWTCSTVSYFTVHPDVRGHGLGSALLREFMHRARLAGSQWMTMQPAECGTRRELSPTMAALCTRTGLRYVEPLAEHRRNAPMLMAAPLTETPDFRLRSTCHSPQQVARRRIRHAHRQPAHAA